MSLQLWDRRSQRSDSGIAAMASVVIRAVDRGLFYLYGQSSLADPTVSKHHQFVQRHLPRHLGVQLRDLLTGSQSITWDFSQKDSGDLRLIRTQAVSKRNQIRCNIIQGKAGWSTVVYEREIRRRCARLLYQDRRPVIAQLRQQCMVPNQHNRLAQSSNPCDLILIRDDGN